MKCNKGFKIKLYLFGFILVVSSVLLSSQKEGSLFENLSSPIKFVSAESMHANGDPIFNRIQYYQQKGKDVWLMQQSQNGDSNHFSSWDRLAIVVDQKESTVEYYQLKPGELDATQDLKSNQIAYGAACLRCHVNGPRSIRPRIEQMASFDSIQKIKLWWWNRKIKSYPPLQVNKAQVLDSLKAPHPLFELKPSQRERLNLSMCARCHNNEKSGRGYLTKSNAETIRFLVENNYMPPKRRISNEEKEKIFSLLD